VLLGSSPSLVGKGVSAATSFCLPRQEKIEKLSFVFRIPNCLCSCSLAESRTLTALTGAHILEIIAVSSSCVRVREGGRSAKGNLPPPPKEAGTHRFRYKGPATRPQLTLRWGFQDIRSSTVCKWHASHADATAIFLCPLQ